VKGSKRDKNISKSCERVVAGMRKMGAISYRLSALRAGLEVYKAACRSFVGQHHLLADLEPGDLVASVRRSTALLAGQPLY
jgi:hypothetical protein